MNRLEHPHLYEPKRKFFWTQRQLVWFSFAVICLVVWNVLFVEPHIGAADNGDFSRFTQRVGIGRLPDGDYSYFYSLSERWAWLPLSWRQLTPLEQSYGNIWPITLIRLITNLFGDTAVTPFYTYTLAILYALMLLLACFLLLRFVTGQLAQGSPVIILAGMFLFLGSMHLGYFNSFYGEAMLFVGLFLTGGIWAELVSSDRSPVRRFILFVLTCFCSYLFLLAKPQGVLAFPLWAGLLTVTGIFICRPPKTPLWTKILCAAVLAIYCAWTGLSCWKLYVWNSEVNETCTLYSSIMYGALMLTDSDEEARAMLEDMGLDPSLARDKGHHAYTPAEDVYLSPLSEEAQEVLYDKVNTFDVLRFYLTHPRYLYRAMEVTAQKAVRPYDTLLQFSGNTHDDQDSKIGRFPCWQELRQYVVPHHFWQYVVIYALLFAVCIRSLIRRRKEPRHRLYLLFYIVLMLTGIIQYPLPFIGNGYADTTKQLYLFMLCWDLTMLIALGWLLSAIRKRRTAKRLPAADDVPSPA